jgi:hypothetical protein
MREENEKSYIVCLLMNKIIFSHLNALINLKTRKDNVVLGMLLFVAETICRHLTSLPPGFEKFMMAAWPSYYRLLSRTSQAVTK